MDGKFGLISVEAGGREGKGSNGVACFRMGDQRGLKGEVLVKLRPKRGEGISHMKNWGKSVGTERTAGAKVQGIHGGEGGQDTHPGSPLQSVQATGSALL